MLFGSINFGNGLESFHDQSILMTFLMEAKRDYWLTTNILASELIFVHKPKDWMDGSHENDSGVTVLPSSIFTSTMLKIFKQKYVWIVHVIFNCCTKIEVHWKLVENTKKKQKSNQPINSAGCNCSYWTRNPVLFTSWFLFFCYIFYMFPTQLLHVGRRWHELSIHIFVGMFWIP
jgi:hypothetical protein